MVKTVPFQQTTLPLRIVGPQHFLHLGSRIYALRYPRNLNLSQNPKGFAKSSIC